MDQTKGAENPYQVIEGLALGHNALRVGARLVLCWTNAMQEAVAPRPLLLDEYAGMFVRVEGVLHGDLYSAKFVEVIDADERVRIEGRVVGSNRIEVGESEQYACFVNEAHQGFMLPLNLAVYMNRIVAVTGIRMGDALYGCVLEDIAPEADVGDRPGEATSLADLLRIRADPQNRALIEAVNGNLGTALGHKYTNGVSTGNAAILVFVPQKIAPELVPEGESVPPTLELPDGTWCRTDVIAGERAGSLAEIDPLPPLGPDNLDLVYDLRMGRAGLVGGIQLAFFGDGIQDQDHAFVGTAGVAVRRADDGALGFLTNQHVADAPGRIMYHPTHGRYPFAYTAVTREIETDQSWYDGLIDEANSYVRSDCGFVRVFDGSQPGMPDYTQFVQAGVHAIGALGELKEIDLDSTSVLGQRVMGVGRTRGLQRGTIVGYAYEFNDDYYSIYTDLLIAGDGDAPFSWKGDSGKLIVTVEEEEGALPRPIGLLWGGWQEKLRRTGEQELFSYGIDLKKVLDRLGLEIHREEG